MIGYLAEGYCSYRILISFIATDVEEGYRNQEAQNFVHLLQDNVPVHNSHITQKEVLSCGYDIRIHLLLLTLHLFPSRK